MLRETLQGRNRRPPSGVQPALAVTAASVLALTLFAAAYLRDLGLPGLYMDAINPEYLIPGILEPPQPLAYIVPGNHLGGRFPLLTGTVYHGSAQLYAALPFLAIFGSDLIVFRVFQLMVGGVILALLLRMSASGAVGSKRVIAVGAAGAVALDPSFVLALRTQAYSTIFPLLLLLGSVLLLQAWRDGRRPWLRLVASGILFGLAVFSYFIFAFFFPALLWLVLRRPHPGGERRTWSAAFLWLAGSVVGYAPLICGMLLMRNELGGWPELMAWLRETGAQLQVTQDRTGLLGRIDTVVADSGRVLTGEWPWLMILGRSRVDLIDSAKAGILVAIPLVVLVARRFSSRGQWRPLLMPIALLVSFHAGALAFGSRLDGHHYTAVLPLVYVAFAYGCAVLWPSGFSVGRNSLTVSPHNVARVVLVLGAISMVAVTNGLAQQRFHRDLVATGGVRLYSDAIDRFGREVRRQDPGATLYTPDWGFGMPMAFLTDAAHVRGAVKVAAIRRGTCRNIPQLVVLAGTGNEGKLWDIARLARRPIERIVTWSQRDGVPVFQVARFAPTMNCGPQNPEGRQGSSPAATAPEPQQELEDAAREFTSAVRSEDCARLRSLAFFGPRQLKPAACTQFPRQLAGFKVEDLEEYGTAGVVDYTADQGAGTMIFLVGRDGRFKWAYRLARAKGEKVAGNPPPQENRLDEVAQYATKAVRTGQCAQLDAAARGVLPPPNQSKQPATWCENAEPLRKLLAQHSDARPRQMGANSRVAFYSLQPKPNGAYITLVLLQEGKRAALLRGFTVPAQRRR